MNAQQQLSISQPIFSAAPQSFCKSICVSSLSTVINDFANYMGLEGFLPAGPTKPYNLFFTRQPVLIQVFSYQTNNVHEESVSEVFSVEKERENNPPVEGNNLKHLSF